MPAELVDDDGIKQSVGSDGAYVVGQIQPLKGLEWRHESLGDQYHWRLRVLR
jgi:hypothetical protein